MKMKLKVYSIFDSAAKAYVQPFYMHNDGLAIRAFMDNVNSKEENNISKHPDQFTLFQIGEFDDTSGKIDSIDPKSLGNGLEFKNDEALDKMSALINKLEKYLEDK
jgi:hypothetical protein